VTRPAFDETTQVAAMMYGVEPEDVTPDMRRSAKSALFAQRYRVGGKGIADILEVAERRARLRRQAFRMRVIVTCICLSAAAGLLISYFNTR
jgi:DNA polymerase I-like protein with 3'-5' exonuclease and polymerase domains